MFWLYILCIIIISQIIVLSENIVFNATNTPTNITKIECMDHTTACIIHCAPCRDDLEIHCHRTASQICEIQSINNVLYLSIYTHQSPQVHFNITSGRLQRSTIYAHERMGAKLYIKALGYLAFARNTIYAPVGEGSLLVIKAARNQNDIKLYDDWTTEVHLYASSLQSFFAAAVSNIFDDINSPLNISRNDSNYIGLNTQYRAPVFLIDCHEYYGYSGTSGGFERVTYYGRNHGDWTLYSNMSGSHSSHQFIDSIINASSDIAPNNAYNIRILGDFRAMTLDANQRGANVYLEAIGQYAGGTANIFAAKASSLTMYCDDNCANTFVQCPVAENNGNNSCRIYCDSTKHKLCKHNDGYNIVTLSTGCDIYNGSIAACGDITTVSSIDLLYSSFEPQCDVYHPLLEASYAPTLERISSTALERISSTALERISSTALERISSTALERIKSASTGFIMNTSISINPLLFDYNEGKVDEYHTSIDPERDAVDKDDALNDILQDNVHWILIAILCVAGVVSLSVVMVFVYKKCKKNENDVQFMTNIQQNNNDANLRDNNDIALQKHNKADIMIQQHQMREDDDDDDSDGLYDNNHKPKDDDDDDIEGLYDNNHKTKDDDNNNKTNTSGTSGENRYRPQSEAHIVQYCGKALQKGADTVLTVEGRR